MIKYKGKTIWIGKTIFYLFSGIWLLFVLCGFFTFGWLSRFSDLTPAEFVVQTSALFFPILFLYLLGSYIDRKYLIDFETKAIKSYLEELVYPSDLGAKHISTLSADLKQQIQQIKSCFNDVFKQTNQVREDLTTWIGDLNSVIGHMEDQTQAMSSYVQQLSEASLKAKKESADAGQNLATQADILIKVTDEADKKLKTAALSISSQAEEITQNVHAVEQSEKSIEKSLDKSADWISQLSVNAHQIEKSLKTTENMKNFLEETNQVLLKCKEIGTTLDLRLKTLKKNVPAETSLNPLVETPTSVSAKEFTEKMQQILEVLQGLSVEMTSVFELKNEETLWAQYYAGDKSIFMRHIKSMISQAKYQKIIKNAAKNSTFQTIVQDYMTNFEELTRGLENSPWLGVLVGSDPGRLYMMLATLFKGEKNADKAG